MKSWGRTVTANPGSVRHPVWSHETCLNHSGKTRFLAQGFARSYGDVCLTTGTQIRTCYLNRILSWDPQTGKLHCEAGTSLTYINSLTIPDGWFLPVTPGTGMVSLGGAVANDVHGKNHHKDGSFGHHVTGLTILRSDQKLLNCSSCENSEIFRATIGGIGLTGLIISVRLNLQKIPGDRIRASVFPFGNIQEYLEIAEERDPESAYSVAWADSLSTGKQGRGIYLSGEHQEGYSEPETHLNLKAAVPFEAPRWLLNDHSMRIFNEFYFRLQCKKKMSFSKSISGFFYPLDKIGNWNLLYGSSGFYQYQCVIPFSAGKAAFCSFFEKVLTSTQKPYLTVIKTFGEKKSAGLLSFPLPGYTLAMDYHAKSVSALKLFDEMDTHLARLGGRIYPAKDARVAGDFFRHSYSHYDEFLRFVDPAFSSLFWKRISKNA